MRRQRRWRARAIETELKQEWTSDRDTLGILAPRSRYCCGFFRKLTNSRISSLASSQPATSLNFTSMLSFIILAVDSLMLKGPPLPPPGPPPIGPRRRVNNRKPISSRVGSMLIIKELREKRGIFIIRVVQWKGWTLLPWQGSVPTTPVNVSVSPLCWNKNTKLSKQFGRAYVIGCRPPVADHSCNLSEEVEEVQLPQTACSGPTPTEGKMEGQFSEWMVKWYKTV